MNSPASYYSIQHSSTEISADATVNVTVAAETIRHPNYNPDDSHLHDIGLVRVNILFILTNSYDVNQFRFEKVK